EQAWNYREEDWATAAQTWAAAVPDHPGQGIDVILDMVGGDYFPKHVAMLGRDGRLVHIAFGHGSEVALDLRQLMGKRLVITGSTLRSRAVAEKSSLRDGVEKQLWPLISSGTVRPIIDCVYPMSEAAEAHRRMESSQHIGKILMAVG